MKTAFVITKTSELLLHTLVSKMETGWVDVYTNNEETVGQIEQLGIECIYLPPVYSESKVNRDRRFNELFMPGLIDGSFSNDNFPMWQSLSLDRYKFWFDDGYETYNWLPKYNVCYVSLDVHSVFPWIIECDKRVGIKIGDLTDKTMTQFLLISDRMLQEIIVSFDDELEYLPWKKSFGLERPVYQKVDNTQLKNQYSYGLPIIGIIFDKQNDWQYRKLIKQMVDGDLSPERVYLVAIPIDERSRQLFPLYTNGELELQSINMLKYCDTIVDFKFREKMWRNYPDAYHVLDFGDVNIVQHIKKITNYDFKVANESSDIFR